MLSRDLWMRIKPPSIKLILKCQEHLHFIKSQQNNYTLVNGDTVVKVYRLRICIIVLGAGHSLLALNENASITVISQSKMSFREALTKLDLPCVLWLLSLCFQEGSDLGLSEFDV